MVLQVRQVQHPPSSNLQLSGVTAWAAQGISATSKFVGDCQAGGLKINFSSSAATFVLRTFPELENLKATRAVDNMQGEKMFYLMGL